MYLARVLTGRFLDRERLSNPIPSGSHVVIDWNAGRIGELKVVIPLEKLVSPSQALDLASERMT